MEKIKKERIKWSFEEELALAKYFLGCKEEGCNPNKGAAFEFLYGYGFNKHDKDKINAKLQDLWKIEKGKDISHVANNTIEAYKKVSSELQISNIVLETLSHSVSDFSNYKFPNYFSTAFCPRLLTLEEQQVVANILDFPKEPSFCDLLESFIFRLYTVSKGKKPWTYIYNSVDLDHETARYIRKGKRLKPLNLYKLIFGLELSFNEAKLLLSSAKIYLDVLDTIPKRIVVQCLKIPVNNKRIINEAFIKSGEPPLFPFFEEKMQQGKEIKRRYTE